MPAGSMRGLDGPCPGTPGGDGPVLDRRSTSGRTGGAQTPEAAAAEIS